MTGTIVNGNEAILPLVIYDSLGNEVRIRAAVDTGFTGDLTLPAGLISLLNLPFRGPRRATLGDGSEAVIKAYHGLISWHGVPHAVEVLAAETGAVLGMGLLYGSELILPVLDGATFTIRPVLSEDASTV